MYFITQGIDYLQFTESFKAFILTNLQCFDIIKILRHLHWADPGMMHCICITFSGLNLSYPNNSGEVRKVFKNEI